MTDDIPPEAMNEIIELIGDHQQLAAVKRYKDLRGTSLSEAKQFIDDLTEKLRVDLPESLVESTDLSEIMELIYDGQKLQAIKRYRQFRSASLYDAKAFIEKLTEDLRQKSPDRFTVRSTMGCASAMAWMAITMSAALAALTMVLVNYL